jgi:hypothetical protein
MDSDTNPLARLGRQSVLVVCGRRDQMGGRMNASHLGVGGLPSQWPKLVVLELSTVWFGPTRHFLGPENISEDRNVAG